MAQSLYNVSKTDFQIDPPRWSGYSVVAEDMVIPSTDETLRASWVSPDQETISEEGDFSKYFDYTTNPGSVTYTGPYKIVIECTGYVSLKASATGVSARIKWAKNGAPEADSSRFVADLIGNQNTGVLLGVSRRFTVEAGDYVDFFFGSNAVNTLVLYKAEWKIETIAIL